MRLLGNRTLAGYQISLSNVFVESFVHVQSAAQGLGLEPPTGRWSDHSLPGEGGEDLAHLGRYEWARLAEEDPSISDDDDHYGHRGNGTFGSPVGFLAGADGTTVSSEAEVW